MKRLGFCAVASLLLLLSSCQQPNLKTMETLNESWAKIGPWAVQGVEWDESLDDAQKELRKALIADFGVTLQKGLENARGEK